VNRTARVVPDVATFAVDDGFWYTVPEHLSPDLAIGSIVRVPLSGRRVRGWVVEIAGEREGNLKEIAGISGAKPVFDQPLLEGLLWTARHYVAPVSTVLARSTPPNLPRTIPDPIDPPSIAPRDHPISTIASRSATGTRAPMVALVGNWRTLDWLEAIGPVLASGRSVLVIAASAAEVSLIGDAATQIWGRIAAAATGDADRSDTKAWEMAQSPPRLVVGTPKTATWMVEGLGMAVVLEEGRRAMKDRQTPTIHVREVLRTRSRLEGFNVVFFGPTPSVELLSAGAEVVRVGNRAWPLLEVVDRSQDQPGSGFLSDRSVAAIAATAKRGGRVFVYTHRRVGFGSMRCTNCRALRTCSRCGTRLARVEVCPRCGHPAAACRKCGGSEFEEMGTIPERLVSELDRRIGPGTAAVHPADGKPVTIGTERDLAGLPRVDLAVAADVDGMLIGTGYRTTEDALRQLARLALAVDDRPGSRLMLQTSHPDSDLVTTMRRGDPIPYLERILVARAREGAPPASEMIVVELRGHVPETAGADLAGLTDALAMGPVRVDEGMRWLLTGKLGKARLELRDLVHRWRDTGVTVRVDVDPIDV
jgi:primosomal protein N' (replication factor Y)